MKYLCWCCGLSLLLLAACADGNGQPAGEGTTGENVEVEEEKYDYQVLLSQALVDTLRGDARFGLILEPESQEREFVIELETGDFTGGLILVRRGEELPAQGTYQLVSSTDSTADPQQPHFSMLYREGLMKHLESESGTLELSVVTDTLIVGRLEAVLQGTITEGGHGEPEMATVEARGRFRARPGQTGYIIGL